MSSAISVSSARGVCVARAGVVGSCREMKILEANPWLAKLVDPLLDVLEKVIDKYHENLEEAITKQFNSDIEKVGGRLQSELKAKDML